MKLLLSEKRRRELIKKEAKMDIGAGLFFYKDAALESISKTCMYFNWKISSIKKVVKEIVNYGWIYASAEEIRKHPERIINNFFLLLDTTSPATTLCRRTIHENSNKKMNRLALNIWTTRILLKAKQQDYPADYQQDRITKDFLRQIARLSKFDDGPLRAKKTLTDSGIALIIEQKLSGTYLDGGTVLAEDGRPVVGLTLRHDRLDNFWFTLLHELAHVFRHLKSPDECFVDNTEEKSEKNEIERQADKIARNAFIPKQTWRRSDAFRFRTRETISALAEEIEIHPAIIAGRLRYETNDYSLFDDMIGRGIVRKLFAEIDWS